MPSQKIPIRSVLFAVLLIASIVLGACAAPTPAPTEVVEKERGKREEFVQKRDRLKANLESLGG